MASLASYQNGLKLVVVIVLVLIFFFTFFPSISVGSLSEGDQKQMKMVMGSKPPRCMNKCLSCKPCMAALVANPHHKTALSSKRGGDDENYYLLSWKCKCGGKYFQP